MNIIEIYNAKDVFYKTHLSDLKVREGIPIYNRLFYVIHEREIGNLPFNQNETVHIDLNSKNKISDVCSNTMNIVVLLSQQKGIAIIQPKIKTGQDDNNGLRILEEKDFENTLKMMTKH